VFKRRVKMKQSGKDEYIEWLELHLLKLFRDEFKSDDDAIGMLITIRDKRRELLDD